MIGSIKRTMSLKKHPITKNEEKLADLRGTLEAWEYLKLGIDQFPATAKARLELGQKITGLKRSLVESELYEYRVMDFSEA